MFVYETNIAKHVPTEAHQDIHCFLKRLSNFLVNWALDHSDNAYMLICKDWFYLQGLHVNGQQFERAKSWYWFADFRDWVGHFYNSVLTFKLVLFAIIAFFQKGKSGDADVFWVFGPFFK